MSKRWVLWAAVSSLPQAKKISNEDQITLGHEHMARHGGTLVAEIVVPGKSRSITMLETARSKIEQYEELYQRIIKREFDVLGYLDRSRLGRKASLSMTVVGLCHDYGIVTYEYESPPSALDVDETHDGLLMGAIKSVGGEHEIVKMKERRTKGMVGRTQAGKFAKGPVYGYIRDPQSAEYRVIIHPQEAEAIRRMVDLFLAGRGSAFISDEMKRLGYPTRGGTWDGSVIRYILERCEKYVGIVTFNTNDPRFGTVRGVGNYPHILTPELVAAVKAEMSRRSKDHKATSDQCSILSGVCYCATCGRRMVYQSHRDGYVICRAKHDGMRLAHFNTVIEELKQTITGLSLPSAEELGLADNQKKARLEAILRNIDINIQ